MHTYFFPHSDCDSLIRSIIDIDDHHIGDAWAALRLRHAKLENVNEGLSTPSSRERAAASGWPLEARINGDPGRPRRPRYGERGRGQPVEMELKQTRICTESMRGSPGIAENQYFMVTNVWMRVRSAGVRHSSLHGISP